MRCQAHGEGRAFIGRVCLRHVYAQPLGAGSLATHAFRVHYATALRDPSPQANFGSMNRQKIAAIFQRLHDADPEPQGELDYISPYTLLVAVALSAQATDVSVNKATGPLFALADTPEKMIALGEARVRDMIKTIGLYRNKAKNVIGLSEQLIERFGGTVPQTRDELETLPGVGRKTANVVMNIAFGEPTIAVDTHIFRLGNRTRVAPGKTPLDVELKLEKAVPTKFKQHAHHWLILHGRYICKARKPDCAACIINDLCEFKAKEL